MATIKLLNSDFEENDYKLIAIHCPLEPYRLAFFMNKKLQVNFKRSKFDLNVYSKKSDSQYVRFEFEDKNNTIFWNLIENKNQDVASSKSASYDLFSSASISFPKISYLIPELKKVDYFIKIDFEEQEINTGLIIQNIKNSEFITTVYEIDVNKIKSKNNLIF